MSSSPRQKVFPYRQSFVLCSELVDSSIFMTRRVLSIRIFLPLLLQKHTKEHCRGLACHLSHICKIWHSWFTGNKNPSQPPPVGYPLPIQWHFNLGWPWPTVGTTLYVTNQDIGIYSYTQLKYKFHKIILSLTTLKSLRYLLVSSFIFGRANPCFYYPQTARDLLGGETLDMRRTHTLSSPLADVLFSARPEQQVDLTDNGVPNVPHSHFQWGSPSR